MRVGAACLLVATLSGAAFAAAHGAAPPLSEDVLPFIENDYDRALVEARARDVPIFVESWAPW